VDNGQANGWTRTCARRCWGCGAVEESPSFQVCTLCIEEGCEPCAFCSLECLRAATPRHRAFHQEKRRLYQLAEQVATRHWYSAAAAAPIASPYDDLLDSMQNSMSIGGGTAASPAPSQQLSDVTQAAMEYVMAVERTTPQQGARSLPWAERAIAAYALLSSAELTELPRPSWWSDAALKALSLQVLESRPDFVLAWRLRGEVLSARLGEANWPYAPRSSHELAEAGRCLQRAATFGSDELAPADKEHVVRQAVACLKAAQGAAEAERHSRASSGTSTPTGGSHRDGNHMTALQQALRSMEYM
jgi:hypothetical protein